MKPPEPPKCSFDQTLGVMVHRFALGATTCECGAERIEKPTFTPMPDPWRRFTHTRKRKNP